MSEIKVSSSLFASLPVKPWRKGRNIWVYLELIDQFQSDKSFVFPPAVRVDLSWRVFSFGRNISCQLADSAREDYGFCDEREGTRRDKRFDNLPAVQLRFAHSELLNRQKLESVNTFLQGHQPYKTIMAMYDIEQHMESGLTCLRHALC